MSQFLSVLKAPYEFLFGENGIFDGQREHHKQRTELFLGLPAVVLAVLAALFLIVGELSAGKDLEESYSNRIVDAREARREISVELNREMRIKSANAPPGTPQNELISEDDPRLADLNALIADEETYLKKLNSLDPDEPEHLFNLAKLYFAKGDNAQGLAMMKQLAPLDSPGYLEAHLYLASVYQNTKVSSRRDRLRILGLADSQVDRALIRDENNLAAIQMKAQLMMQVNNFEEARKYFRKLFDQEPRIYTRLLQLIERTDNSSDAKLAVLLSAKSRFEEQLDAMQTPSVDRLQMLSLLADCLYRLKDFDDADALINRELRLLTENPQLAQELGLQSWANRILAIGRFLRFAEIGNPTMVLPSNAEEKIRLLQEGFELDPTNANILRTLTQLQASPVAGVKEKVVSIYDARNRSDSIAEVDNVLGVVALGEGRFRDAFEFFDRACRKDPKNSGYLNNRAYTRMQEATRQLEIASQNVEKMGDEATPESQSFLDDAKKNVISAAAKAVADVDQAIGNIRAGSGSTRFLTNYYDTKGNALMLQGNYNLAAAEFLRAAVGRPNDPNIAASIRDCYQKDGQTERAKIWEAKHQQLLAQTKNKK